MVRWAKVQLLTSIFFAMLHAKNYQNRLMFHGVIRKIKVAPVFWDTMYL